MDNECKEGVRAWVEEAGYRPGRAVLRGAGLRAEPGETLIVVGRSGSGKTTLFLSFTGVIVNLLGGYLRGYSRICGINPLPPEGFRQVPALLGVVLQDPDKQLSLLTPLEEVLFVLENLGVPEEEARRRAKKALERFGLAGKALEDSARLSGGEKRRLTLAAALVHDPPVLLLDEPTASLDPWGVAEVRRLVREEAKRGRVVLVIEHKARYFLDLADRVVALSGGRSVGEWGRPAPREELARLGADVHEPLVRPVEPGGGPVILRAQGLEAGYEEHPLLSVESLEVRAGDVLAIAGPNGSGKTTLLKTLAGIIEPVSGEVWVREGYRPFYVPQLPDYMFMMRTVRAELEYSAGRGLGPGALEQVLRQGWLREALDRPPYTLSHGQRRWLTLEIARLHGARLLLLDEPSTGLDVGLYGELCHRLWEWAGRGAVIVSTHDPRIVGECSSRAAMVMDGRLVEAGREKVVRLMEVAWRA